MIQTLNEFIFRWKPMSKQNAGYWLKSYDAEESGTNNQEW